MGRKRKEVTENNEIVSETKVEEGDANRKTPHEQRAEIEGRIGLTKQVCQDCDARNAKSADKCRKCGSGNLRDKNDQFAGPGSNGS